MGKYKVQGRFDLYFINNKIGTISDYALQQLSLRSCTDEKYRIDRFDNSRKHKLNI